jgi:hypothetical protein
MVYVPGISVGTTKCPSGPLTASREMPVASLVTVTVTPGRTDFAWSNTVPLMTAFPPCATTVETRQPTTTMLMMGPSSFDIRPPLDYARSPFHINRSFRGVTT